ncbi:HlyD family efflux transporter periplasmic adaptor subunit [Arcobacter sp. YIC-310]|uniref:HlyD family efflux transporter periplasmic adaptor subunit n=1 Tax=Arcobacter sp. YIC-310 TaxID=3376632 RepID=UPI003C19A135
MLEQKNTKLPFIREELQLLEAGISENGEKNWLIFDPIQERYFNISYDTFKLISLWQSNEEIKIFLEILKKNDYDIDEENLFIFIDYLKKNNLLKTNTKDDISFLYSSYNQGKTSTLKWLLKNYLFIRIPLFKCDKFLEKNLKKVEFFYTNFYSSIILFLGFIGVLLALRDYEEFINTFSYLFSYEGMFYYLLSVIFVKSLHELGHAFTAKRNKVRVPTMGVAFLVLFPVLYTDTTNSWRLKSKKKRLQIVLAGVKVELYLALICIFLWSFLPDGIFKTIAFVVATTSLVTSLLINISPFLRFDGYYVLSDITNTKNLQPRAFAMSRWFLRRYILGSNEKVPEYLPLSKQRFFIIYGIATWIYRFFLFLGIAILVYYFTFKVLGIILFIVEIIWFIILPIYNELKIWFKKINEVSFNMRNIVSLIIFIGFVFLLIYPWNTKINMPSVLEAKDYSQIYSPIKAKVEKIYIKNKEKVNKGDLLIKLHSFENEYKLKQILLKKQLVKVKLNKMAGNKEFLENRFILEEELLRLTKQEKALNKISKSLEIRAPFSGIVSKNFQLHEGLWINPKNALLNIYNPNSFEIIAYCKEEDYSYIKNKAKGKFIFDNYAKNIDVKFVKVSNISSSFIYHKALSSLYGGDIAVSKTKENTLRAEKSYYKVYAKALNLEKDYDFMQKGVLVVEAKPQSIIKKAYIKVLSILIRESGF